MATTRSGTLKLYADTPGRRTAQVLADVLFVLWLVLWVWVGNEVHDATLALAEPGRQTTEAATSMSGGFTDAGDYLRGVPIVGDEVAVPFEKASGASDSLADAGRTQVAAVEKLALWLGVSIAAIPILVVAAIHLPLRWRFVRRATAGARFVDAAEDLDLFALRALARQPMHVLARVSDDPAGAWRAKDPDIVRVLAQIELRASGLRLPPAR
jgi:hypothetical protein